MIQDDYLAPSLKGPLKLQQHQYRILNHCFTPKKGSLPYKNIVYSCPKKSGKTEIAGAVAYAWCKTYGGDVYSIANDKEQATGRAFDRVIDCLKIMKQQEPDRFEEEVDEEYHRVINKNDQTQFRNGANLRAVPLDPYGEAGGMQTLTIWDELWGFRSDAAMKMWTEMQPIPPGIGSVRESIRFIVTYAGWLGESELLWNIYEDVCVPDENGNEQGEKAPGLEDLPCYVKHDTFVYWDHVCRMPMHTPEFLKSARNDPGLKGSDQEYLRIWENRWTTGLESFINIERYDQLVAEGERIGLHNNMENIIL